jgi:hypothetical protein
MNSSKNTILSIRLGLCSAALLAFLFLAPTNARALKESARMTPDALEPSGFSMTAENQKDGTVEFTLTRDLSEARSFGPDSALLVRRSATLNVHGRSGLLAKCNIEPVGQKDTIVYRFVIARDCVPDSHFTLAEIDDYKDQTGERLIGGGTFYEFRLALFAP